MLERYKNPLLMALAFAAVLAVGIPVLFLLPITGNDSLIPAATILADEEPVPAEPVLHTFIEVMDSCDAHHGGSCVSIRSAPTSTASSALKIRTGAVLPVASSTITDASGRVWHKISFREWIRYPERMSGEWYIADEFVRRFEDVGAVDLGTTTATTTKRILVDRSEQKLYAYEGDTLFLEVSISTGRDLTPTPRGVFTVYRKTPSRYMQGPLHGISDQYYDLPGVPWNMYFTEEGGAIHGAYWHEEFGTPWSHGCVNLPLEAAETLYYWTPLGTQVTVRD